jgi:hypothetical protein
MQTNQKNHHKYLLFFLSECTIPEKNINVNYKQAIRKPERRRIPANEIAETNLWIRIMEMEINWAFLEKLWSHIEPFFVENEKPVRSQQQVCENGQIMHCKKTRKLMLGNQIIYKSFS